MASGSYRSNTGVNCDIVINWTSTTNINTNTSTVVVRAYLEHYNINIGSRTVTISCNGSSQKWNTPSIYYMNGNKQSTFIGEATFTVSHDATGSKACSIGASVNLGITYNGTYLETIGASGTATLETIPRSSTISSLTSSIEINGSNSLTVQIHRASSSFTHDVKYTLGNYNKTITGVTTQSSFVLPIEWLKAMPNSTSLVGKVSVITKNGAVMIGNAVTANFTATVPINIKPSIGELKSIRVDNGVPAAWGIYVQGKSCCKLTMNQISGAYGSSIKKYSIIGGGYSTQSDVLTTGVLKTSGTIMFEAQVTDSRGRVSDKKTVEINVVPYTNPIIKSVLSQRSNASGTLQDDGQYVRCVLTTATAGCLGKNVIKRTVLYRAVGGEWSSQSSLSDNIPVVIGSNNISMDQSYEVKYSVSDSFTRVEKIDIVSTAFTTVDFKKGGKGIAIGKVAENDNQLDIAMPTLFRDSVSSPLGEFPILTNEPYPQFKMSDGSDIPKGYIRTPQYGIIPNQALPEDGSGNCGTIGYPFKNIHGINIFRKGNLVWDTSTLKYQTGVWTPTGTDISSASGKYVRIGSQVTVWGKCYITKSTSTSAITVGTLPFPCAAGIFGMSGSIGANSTMTAFSNVNKAETVPIYLPYMNENSSSIVFCYFAGGRTWGMISPSLINSGSVYFTLTYITQ